MDDETQVREHRADPRHSVVGSADEQGEATVASTINCTGHRSVDHRHTGRGSDVRNTSASAAQSAADDAATAPASTATASAVARLEQVIGSRLLERSSSGVRLTAIGRTLHERVSAGFDLWIPFGLAENDDLEATEFCAEEIVPVAAPSIAERLPYGEPAALLEAPLLHLEERYAPRFDWRRWFDAQGVAAPASLAGYRSTDYSLIVQGALDGQGLALGWMHIVEALIHNGRLVALAAPLRTEKSFPILQRRDRPLSPAAAALRDWLKSIGYRPTTSTLQLPQ